MTARDELRDEADRLARRGSGADAHIVRAAADAWQKDLDNWLAEVKRITASASAVEESLRKRLEAAERLIARIEEWDGKLVRDCRAALAGEEK